MNCEIAEKSWYPKEGKVVKIKKKSSISFKCTQCCLTTLPQQRVEINVFKHVLEIKPLF